MAVVGTRRASADGLEVARALGRGLAAAGVTVVSGMALGVDSAAHAGALESSGRTVAVLAGGADVPYPPSKARLHGVDRRARLRDRRAAAGVRGDALVLSGPQSHHRRAGAHDDRGRGGAAVGLAHHRGDRASTSDATSARCPVPVTAWRSAGTNALLRDGATVIRDAADALDVAVGVDRHEATVLHLEPRLRALLGAVADGRDTLAALARVPAEVAPTLAALTELELLGHLRRVTGGRYVVIPHELRRRRRHLW